ncbi:MAG: hypothetical protein FJ297_16350 [Planctomycetes bacterium]|nr:hypothetical protein [Planctomycetota bacterium]
MVKRLAVFGDSFNPPHRNHRAIAEALAERFDEVRIVPCGPRPDNPRTNDVEAYHRAAMVDMNFAGLDRVRVDLFDLEQKTFTQTHELERRFEMIGDVWHVIDADLARGGGRGVSEIQTHWESGTRLWNESKFLVVQRPGGAVDAADWPPNHAWIEIPEPMSSSEIRSRIFHREAYRGELLPRVADYIERHRLYLGSPSARSTRIRLSERRFEVCFDERNSDAAKLAAQLDAYRHAEPELIVVIGGDGTMLRAVRQHWRRRVPFFGVNTGHLGFLLNDVLPMDVEEVELPLWHLPLLYVDLENEDGAAQKALAFNDTWVERATGQTAWIEVGVDGHVRLPRLVADGALIATSAGSTAYARAMGAAPMPLGTPALLLVGSNVLRPAYWRPVVLPIDTEVRFTSLDPEKRPLQAYVDGVAHGNIRRLIARVSNTAGVEMVFAPPHDPGAKLAAIQFP